MKMPMRPILYALCIALSLPAGSATAQAVQAMEEPAPGDAALWINAPGGKYHDFETGTFGDPVNLKAELTLERVNPHPKWAARAGVCVHGAASDYRACVHASRLYEGSSELQVSKSLYKDDGRTLVASEPVAGTFSVGSRMRIELRSGADTVEFKVGDGPWMMQALPFSPQTVKLSCSSALCRLRLR